MKTATWPSLTAEYKRNGLSVLAILAHKADWKRCQVNHDYNIEAAPLYHGAPAWMGLDATAETFIETSSHSTLAAAAERGGS